MRHAGCAISTRLSPMESTEASKTAALVCQGRAFGHGRMATERFSDPIAEQLLRPDEMEPVSARPGRDGAE